MFVAAPCGGQQQPLGTVPADAVDHHLRGQEGDGVDHQIQVLLQGEDGKGLCLVEAAQICAPQDVEELELHPVRRQVAHGPDGVQHHLPALPGNSQDHMDDDGEPGFL